MNEFSKKSNARNNVYRSTHDLSFQNNLTLKFGAITPVFCREVLPGDSFRIKPTFGIRALPLVFPCQTRMKAYLHFFYVRNRTLWRDWTDFITGTKSNLTSPYIAPTSKVKYRVSSLADYLGLPCVNYSTSSDTYLLELHSVEQFFSGIISGSQTVLSPYISVTGTNNIVYNVFSPVSYKGLSDGQKVSWPTSLQGSNIYHGACLCRVSASTHQVGIKPSSEYSDRIYFLDKSFTVISSFKFSNAPANVITNVEVPSGTAYVLLPSPSAIDPTRLTSSRFVPPQSFFTGLTSSRVAHDADDMPANPFRSVSLAPSALPFRAYQSIYNAYYSN